MKVGVLALQGAVREHLRMIEMTGHEAIPVKKVDQLTDLDGLIIPGGESTTIGKLIKQYNFTGAIQEFSKAQKPLFGTCAGLIIIAKEINQTTEHHLSLMDIKVERNAFGRQKESFEADIQIKGVADNFPSVFIRAPYIMETGDQVEILAVYQDKIVAARQGHLLGAAFHPELTDDHRMHQYFIEMVIESKQTVK